MGETDWGGNWALLWWVGQCSVQFSHSVVFDSVIPWTAARQASLSITISRSLLKLMSFESVMPSNHLIFCHPLLLLPSIFPSIKVFSNESALPIRWPKYWSFSFSIRPSNEYSGLISFRMDWFYLLVVQGTLKSLLQHHNSKASILWCAALKNKNYSFFNWRIIALQNFVVFCQTSTWNRHSYTYIPSLLILPPISCCIPPI